MYLKICTFVCCFLFLTAHHSAAANENIHLSIDDQYIQFNESTLMLQHNTIYAPLQKIIKLFNGATSISGDKQTITAILGKNTLTLNKTTKKATRNGSILNNNELAVINGTAYISLSYLAGINHYYYKKIENKPLIRMNSTTPTLSETEYLKKMEKYISYKEKPTVYLTFDDGPNKYTAQNLATLKKFNAKATFFFIGNHLKEQKTLVKATYNLGHTIGLHSMTHQTKILYATKNSFIKEMLTEQALIASITGASPALVRTPYGSVPWLTKDMQQALIENNLKLWDWDVDPKDWQLDTNNYAQIVLNVKEGIIQAEKRKDQHIVILLHDRNATSVALPYILKWLQEKGYIIEAYQQDHHIIQNFLANKKL